MLIDTSELPAMIWGGVLLSELDSDTLSALCEHLMLELKADQRRKEYIGQQPAGRTPAHTYQYHLRKCIAQLDAELCARRQAALAEKTALGDLI